jgi:hypothetical protein
MKSKLRSGWKYFFIAGLALIFYGYVCRMLSIYFFWESRYIGWLMLLIGLCIFLWRRIRSKRIRGAIPELIGLVIGLLIILIQSIILIVFSNTGAYKSALRLIKNERRIISETGTLKNISIVPVGQIGFATTNSVEYGSASFTLILKGEKKYKDLSISLVKKGKDWEIIEYK